MRVLCKYSFFVAAELMLMAFYASCALPNRNSNVLSSNENGLSNFPTVEYCDVVKNPSAYQSKLIRMKSVWQRISNDIILGDENCVTYHPLVAMKLDPTFENTDESEPGKKLDQIIRGDNETQKKYMRIDVIAVGVLDKIPENEFKGYGPHLQYRFTVRRVDEITRTQSNSSFNRTRY